MMKDDIQCKRLFMRANRRGMKELDVILGGFARRHLAQLSHRDQFENLLACADQDILNWVLARVPAPNEFSDLIAQIRADIAAHPASQ